jgi:hypothetical protein
VNKHVFGWLIYGFFKMATWAINYVAGPAVSFAVEAGHNYIHGIIANSFGVLRYKLVTFVWTAGGWGEEKKVELS